MPSTSLTSLRRRLFVHAAAAVAAVVAAGAASHLITAARAPSLYAGSADIQRALARTAVRHVEARPTAADFSTGAALFDAEWAFGAHVMSGLGLAQVALAHPALRPELDEAAALTAARLLTADVRAFGVEAWGSDLLSTDEPPASHGHAYLGYGALALGLLRTAFPVVDEDPALRRGHERLIARLAARLRSSEHGLLETYPDEAYPVDVASVIGALAVHGRLTGTRHDDVLRPALGSFRARYVDASSGMLHQSASAPRGEPTGPPRGSGTALAIYFLSFADRPLAEELWRGLRRSALTSLLGFGGMREYAPGLEGRGDVDSGPVVLGVSVSATGFALAGARLFGDEAAFTSLWKTTALFGMPYHDGDALTFAAGGPLGDAILFAMVTAGPGGAS